MDLNICLLNDSFPPQIDGVANTVINYAQIISEGLGRCTVVAPKYPDVFDHYDFPVLRYPSINTARFVGYRTGYPFGVKTLNYLEKSKFDIIHTHCPMASGLLARTLRERVEAPLICTYHTKFDIDIAKVVSSEWSQNTAIRLMVNNINACDEVWAVSEGAGKNLRSLGFQGDYIVMENGVDLSPEKSHPDNIAALQKELSLTPNVPVFLFVGRCMWYKGIRISLDALSCLKKDGKNFYFIVVGTGTDLDDIKQYAVDKGIADNCRFVGAIYDRELLRDYYSVADLFLFPSSYDTNGLVVREAAATALPSVIIENSCAAEGCTDEKNAICIAENAEAMAKALSLMYTDPQAVRQIGKAAQQDLYLSWQDAVNKAYHRYEYLYEKMAAEHFPPKDAQGNTLFEMIADWNAGLSKVMGLPRTVIEKIKK